VSAQSERKGIRPWQCLVIIGMWVFGFASDVKSDDALYLVDEILSINGETVSEKINPIDQFMFLLNISFDNGFILERNRPVWNAGCQCCGGTKSVSMHGKAFNIIIDDELIDGEESMFPGIFPGSPEQREFAREGGFFYILPLLGYEVTGDLLTDFGRLIGSIDFGTILTEGAPIELVVYRDGELVDVLRSDDPEVEMPRDAYLLVDSMPCDDSEWVFEFRTSFDVSSPEIEELCAGMVPQGAGPMTVTIPFKMTTGVHVSCLRTGEYARCPRMTPVDMIADPSDDLCPSDAEAWWYDDEDPNKESNDLGERCFDVDYTTDFDLFPFSGGGGGEEGLGSGFAHVLDPDFDTQLKPWFLHNALRNSGFRLLDTVNETTGVPSNFDAEPLSELFRESYDGVPLIVAQQLEYLRIGRDAVSPETTGGLGRLNKLLTMSGDYSNIRRVRLFVRYPGRGLQQVTLPQLMQTIAWNTWDKEPAYVGENDLMEDHPRVDFGEIGPMKYMIRAVVKVEGKWQPLKAVVSAQAGLYETNVYSGCIYGIEEVCGGAD